MKKKAVTVLLAGIMACGLAFTGCGGESGQENAGQTKETVETAAESEVEQTEPEAREEQESGPSGAPTDDQNAACLLYTSDAADD